MLSTRVDTGIGEYNLADYLLSVSSTARDGVEKLGAIIDQYGSQDCNQIVIADNTETWIFAQLSGHQWIAVKMGDDVASVNPNIGGLQYKVDLDDASQCLHSADVVTLPESNGVLVTYDDGTPNIFKTYGKENSGSSQNTRLAQGRAYFGAALAPQTDYTVDEQGRVTSLIDPQLTFTPGIKSDTFTALRSLAARGEQDDGLNANLNSACMPSATTGRPRAISSRFGPAFPVISPRFSGKRFRVASSACTCQLLCAVDGSSG